MKLTLKADTLDLSVVIASLNEAPNLYRLLPLLRESLDALNLSWEILVVDGDSGDGTAQVVQQAGARYICEERPGYGTAILRGVTEARGKYVVTMDADMSHPAQFIKTLWENRESGDIVIASRYVPGGSADQPWFRYMLSRILNRFFSRGLSVPVKDMSSGFRLYRKGLFHGMEPKFTNFVLLVELLLLAVGKGMQVHEVPFHYQPRVSGSSKARIIKFGKDYLRLFHRVWRMRNSIDFPDYDWRAYDSRIWLQRYWQRTRHDIILRYAPRFVPTCDVGCGSGRVLADLPHAVGLDLRHDKLLFMKRTNQLLVQADGVRLPFPDGCFECAICSEVIEHVPGEDARILDELARILKPHAILIIGTPDYGKWQWRVLEWFYARLTPGGYADEHVTRYTYDRLIKELTRRNFRIVEYAYIGRAELIVKAQRN